MIYQMSFTIFNAKQPQRTSVNPLKRQCLLHELIHGILPFNLVGKYSSLIVYYEKIN